MRKIIIAKNEDVDGVFEVTINMQSGDITIDINKTLKPIHVDHIDTILSTKQISVDVQYFISNGIREIMKGNIERIEFTTA